MPPALRFGTKQIFPETRTPEALLVQATPGEFIDPFIQQGKERSSLGALANLEKLRAAGALEEPGIKNRAFKSALDVTDFIGITGPGVGQFFDEKKIPTDKISAKKANRDFGIEGELNFNKPVTIEEAQLLNKKKKEEISRRLMSERVTGFADNFAAFGTEFLREIVDPVGFATLFFPSIKIAQAARLTKARAISRLKAGFIEGSVGTGLALAPTFIVGKELKSEFGPLEAGLNVLFGGAFGAGARVGLGKISDALTTRALSKNIKIGAEDKALFKTLDTLESPIQGVSRNADEVAFKSALSELNDTGKVTIAERITKFEKSKALPDNVKTINKRLTELSREIDDIEALPKKSEKTNILLQEVKKEFARLDKLRVRLLEKESADLRKNRSNEVKKESKVKVTKIHPGIADVKLRPDGSIKKFFSAVDPNNPNFEKLLTPAKEKENAFVNLTAKIQFLKKKISLLEANKQEPLPGLSREQNIAQFKNQLKGEELNLELTQTDNIPNIQKNAQDLEDSIKSRLDNPDVNSQSNATREEQTDSGFLQQEDSPLINYADNSISEIDKAFDDGIDFEIKDAQEFESFASKIEPENKMDKQAENFLKNMEEKLKKVDSEEKTNLEVLKCLNKNRNA